MQCSVAAGQNFSDKPQSVIYQDCISQVSEDSAAALSVARRWYIEGGGVAAQHCEALALYEQQRFGEAASLFEAVVGKLSRGESVDYFVEQNKDTLSVQLNYLAGISWHSAQEPDKAYNAFTASLSSLDTDYPYAYDIYIERGLVQVSSEKFENAVEDFASALAINPEKVDAFLFRAETFRKLKQHLKARLDLNAALILEPDHPDVLFESGVNYRMLRNDKKALSEWEKLIAKYPDSHWQKLAKDNISLIGK
jgi:tetratricopeptide (TPR) repeat protein